MIDIFKEYESLVEQEFTDFVFIFGSFLMSNFFNLVSPNLNSNNISDGYPNRPITILQGLFFNYDLEQDGFFSRIGDRYYKASEYFTWSLNADKLKDMHDLLNDDSIKFNEI